MRKKIFESQDCVAVARIFENENRETDVLMIEVVTNKLTKSSLALNLLSPLLILSSRLIVHLDSDDLPSALATTLPSLVQIQNKYDFSGLKAYDQQDVKDVISEFMPKVCFYTRGKQVLQQAKDQKLTDIIEKAIQQTQVDQDTKSQFLVMFKARELFIEGNKTGDHSDFKTLTKLETHPKEFFGRKVKTTPDIAFRFIQNNLEQTKDKLDLNEV